jgi:3-methyladenine DNA glycosylase AlkD
MNLIFKIRQELKKNSDHHTKATGQNFFKEKVKIHGVKTALVTKIAKQYNRDILTMPKKMSLPCAKIYGNQVILKSPLSPAIFLIS